MKSLWFVVFNGAVCVFVFRQVGIPERLHWLDAGLLAVASLNGLVALLHLGLVLQRVVGR